MTDFDIDVSILTKILLSNKEVKINVILYSISFLYISTGFAKNSIGKIPKSLTAEASSGLYQQGPWSV